MKYTIRFCHLEKESPLSIGTEICKGIKIGKMGNSGTKLIHLHVDIVEGEHPEIYRLSQVMGYIKNLESVCKLFFEFLNDDLFDYPLFVSSHFGTIDYGKYKKDGDRWVVSEWKFHPAYDVVPEDRKETQEHYQVYWPVSYKGKVISKGFDYAYGNYINILFERI